MSEAAAPKQQQAARSPRPAPEDLQILVILVVPHPSQVPIRASLRRRNVTAPYTIYETDPS